MAFMYKLTTKINAFTFSHATKPVILEFPLCTDEQFIGFKRIIRVAKEKPGVKNQDMERDVVQYYNIHTIEMKAPTDADLQNMFDDVIKGCNEFVPDADFSTLDHSEMEMKMDNANNWLGKFTITTVLAGDTL
jgi:hypothetical protein